MRFLWLCLALLVSAQPAEDTHGEIEVFWPTYEGTFPTTPSSVIGLVRWPLVAMEKKGKVDITIILDDTIEIAQQERSACSGNGRGEKRGVGVHGEGSRNVGRIRRDDTHTHTHTHRHTHITSGSGSL
mmetsp:Transcript_77645/g.125936  ORF Transcript_77645/g.125936 Transcript_77645/m.125936 type:complete len:128 (+) Transcript_77645:100-483(+)